MGERPSFTHPEFTTPFVTSFNSGLPPGRPVHCYSYGPPAVASSDLAQYARGLITSIVHGSDIVPTLSLGVLRDLRNVSVTLFEEGRVAEEIVGRVSPFVEKSNVRSSVCTSASSSSSEKVQPILQFRQYPGPSLRRQKKFMPATPTIWQQTQVTSTLPWV